MDDEQHRLLGSMTLIYHNNSPHSLDTLYFHVYPNAFRDNTSAYAREQMEAGNLEYLFADKDERGALYGLAFEVNGEPVPWELTDDPDIVKVPLPEPLKPGNSVTISTPFEVKIPYAFSRLGRDGHSYAITQWYPRIAVFDHEGWHLLPYRDIGEFYGEFGTYEVEIVVPSNYVVLATGVLKTETERQWLNQRINWTNETIKKLRELAKKDETKHDKFIDSLKKTPPSSKTKKRLRWVAHNVHDFAWFADKRWFVQKSQVTLPSGKVVDTWTAFLPQNYQSWDSAVLYIDSSLYYFSLWIGEYAWPQATAVEGPLKAGGGMEYPMITIISPGLTSRYMVERVIAHEVGHNWFMGMFGINERIYPWMDEGINSYYEWRYMESRYGYDNTSLSNKKIKTTMGQIKIKSDKLPNASVYYTSALASEFASELLRSFGLDQPLNLRAEKYSELNYGTMIYMRVPLWIQVLEGAIGREKLDRAMQTFYKDWHLKHPDDTALIRSFQKAGVEAPWLFDYVLKTERLPDWYFIWVTPDTLKIGNRKFRTLYIGSRNGIPSPIYVVAYKNDSIVAQQWYDVHPDMMKDDAIEVIFPAGDYDKLVINPQIAPFVVPEESYRDNLFRVNRKRRWTRRKLSLRLLGGIDGPQRYHVGLTPFIGWNTADGIWIGVHFNNFLLTGERFEFSLLPALALKSQTFVGTGNIGYYWYPGFHKPVHYIKLGVEGRTFGIDNFNRYGRVSPYLKISFDPDSWHKPLFTFFHAYAHWIELARGTDKQSKWFGQINFSRKWQSSFNPWSFEADISGGQSFARISLSGNYNVTYNKKGKDVGIRAFAGFMPFNSETMIDPRFTISSWAGYQDFFFSHYYLSRAMPTILSRSSVLYSKQVYIEDGGFLTPTNLRADKWLLAFKLYADMPFKFPIRVFANIGAWQDSVSLNNGYEVGITVGKEDVFALHIPLVVSQNIEDGLCGVLPCPPDRTQMSAPARILRRITFTLNLDFKLEDLIRDRLRTP
ncbi:MAG: M1 family metallopeptidase [Chlorobi bacterium]|nr:M1 family metallopeptidase [Chlorobiota bacterium]